MKVLLQWLMEIMEFEKKKLILGYCSTLDRRYLPRPFFSAIIILYFSLRHKLPHFVCGEYGVYDDCGDNDYDCDDGGRYG